MADIGRKMTDFGKVRADSGKEMEDFGQNMVSSAQDSKILILKRTISRELSQMVSITKLDLLFYILMMLTVTVTYHWAQRDSNIYERPTYIMLGGKSGNEETLNEVRYVLDRLGFRRVFERGSMDWNLLWSHRHPQKFLENLPFPLKWYQRVNHIPMIHFLVTKVNLATQVESKYIPKGFTSQEELLEYAAQNPGKRFVQKSIFNRHVQLKNISEIEFRDKKFFVQEFVESPLLNEGRMFDIGVFTVITSIDPLRVYIFHRDIILRHCPEPYHPFDANNTDKYVIAGNYVGPWDVPSIAKYFNATDEFSYSHKDSLNAHFESKGVDLSTVWHQIEDCIRNVILAQQPQIVESVSIGPICILHCSLL